MNKVILTGRLTRDPETRYSDGTISVCKYTLAVDRRYKKEGEVNCDFISCTTFSKCAEFAEKYLRQGTKIAITGRIQTGSYTNKEGQKVYTTEVIVEEHEFCESLKNSQQQAQSQNVDSDGFMNIPEGIDEELPFN